MSSPASSLREASVFSNVVEMSRATTPPSSPPAADQTIQKEEDVEAADEDTEERLRMLTTLIEKSTIYVNMLRQQMDKVKVSRSRRRTTADSLAQPQSANPHTAETRSDTGSRKRPRNDRDADGQPDLKRAKAETSGSTTNASNKSAEDGFEQPALVTGAVLKDYQLEGVAWMASLYQSGISGILADEMGLGKTIQTIAFHAFLRERTPMPFLVVCPLSVLHNWMAEFQQRAPEIPVVMYHGTPEERAEIRRTKLVFSDEDMKYQNRMFGRDTAAPESGPSERAAAKGRGKAANKATKATPRKSRASEKKQAEEESEADGPPTKSRVSSRRKGGKADGRRKYAKSNDNDDADSSDRTTKRGRLTKSAGKEGAARTVADADVVTADAEAGTNPPLPPHQKTNFPVVITTYEMIIKDRVPLSQYYWGFIVVDEGHRLKNLGCKLMQEIKKLNAAARLVLTGTPLQNNLAELWALLNFVLPDLFSDLEAFEEWFNLPALQSTISVSRSTRLIESLHAILKPFILRRLKADVETDLPPKKEYVLYAPLSERQRELYDAIVHGRLRALLVKEGEQQQGSTEEEEEEVPLKLQVHSQTAGHVRKTRAAKRLGKRRKNYDLDGDDDVYFAKLESGELEAEREKEREKNAKEVGIEWQRKNTLRKVNDMKLQNTVMQLRKPMLNDELVTASGKMLILDRLLEELFKGKHKVLLFSQFTTILDIIEDWATEFKGWSLARIDGSTSMDGRREEVNRFQNGGDGPDAPRLFLLSTRAGGVGLNLVAADTVIFYDQDWNPQVDLQAQDRAHRIGQAKPVLIFRLVSAHTIETKIMQRATEKRKLEALVIAKGQFKAPSLAVTRNRPETMAEMAAALLRLEGEQIQVVQNSEAGKASVISDEELDMLLDRRPEVFTERLKGWTSNGKGDYTEDAAAESTAGVPPRKAKFAVYETPVNEGGDLLAEMMAEED